MENNSGCHNRRRGGIREKNILTRFEDHLNLELRKLFYVCSLAFHLLFRVRRKNRD